MNAMMEIAPSRRKRRDVPWLVSILFLVISLPGLLVLLWTWSLIGESVADRLAHLGDRWHHLSGHPEAIRFAGVIILFFVATTPGLGLWVGYIRRALGRRPENQWFWPLSLLFNLGWFLLLGYFFSMMPNESVIKLFVLIPITGSVLSIVCLVLVDDKKS